MSETARSIRSHGFVRSFCAARYKASRSGAGLSPLTRWRAAHPRGRHRRWCNLGRGAKATGPRIVYSAFDDGTSSFSLSASRRRALGRVAADPARRRRRPRPEHTSLLPVARARNGDMSASENGVVRIAGAHPVSAPRRQVELGKNPTIIVGAVPPDTHLEPKTYYRALLALTPHKHYSRNRCLGAAQAARCRARSRVLAEATAEGAGVPTRPRTHPARGCPRRRDSDLPPRDLQALGCLVADIRRKVGAPATHEPTQSRLEVQLARRPQRRNRGDG